MIVAYLAFASRKARIEFDAAFKARVGEEPSSDWSDDLELEESFSGALADRAADVANEVPGVSVEFYGEQSNPPPWEVAS